MTQVFSSSRESSDDPHQEAGVRKATPDHKHAEDGNGATFPPVLRALLFLFTGVGILGLYAPPLTALYTHWSDTSMPPSAWWLMLAWPVMLALIILAGAVTDALSDRQSERSWPALRESVSFYMRMTFLIPLFSLDFLP